MENLIGKKARIVSLNGAVAGGFKVGEEVTIVHNKIEGSRLKGRLAITHDGRDKGYVDRHNLEIIEEEPKSIIGKKAMVLSVAGGSMNGFKVGDMVTIEHSPFRGGSVKVRHNVNTGLHGYQELKHLSIIDESKPARTNGNIKVEVEGFKIEGAVSDVIQVLQQLKEMTA
jgi:hypothetical protein